MERKKKELLRKLTIISIPFVFVAIPSIVIFVGMLTPHAARQDGGSGGSAGDRGGGGHNHSVSLMSTMTGGQMILSCRAQFAGGNWEYFHYFILNPYKPQHAYFQPPRGGAPYAIVCKWGYMGTFLQDVEVFSTVARYAERCRVDRGGCRYLFRDGHMIRVTGTRRPARSQDRAVVGDVPLRECKHVLGVFPTSCHYKPHGRQYVGRIISRMRWWFNY